MARGMGDVRKRLAGAAVLALVAGALVVPNAIAGDVISPSSGATVGSRPNFVFNFTNGVGEVELSRAADVKSSGSDVGAFVDAEASLYSLLYTRSPRDGVAPWDNYSPLNSGSYFWHVKTRDDGDDTGPSVYTNWGPTKTLTVRDEPPVFEGWTMKVRKGKNDRRHKCRVLRLAGKVAASDNDENTKLTLILKIKNKSGKLTLKRRLDYSQRYRQAFCLQQKSATVTAYIRDRSGNLTKDAGKPRTVRR